MIVFISGMRSGKRILNNIINRLNIENNLSIEKYSKPISEFHISETEKNVLESVIDKFVDSNAYDYIGTIYGIKLIVDRKDD